MNSERDNRSSPAPLKFEDILFNPQWLYSSPRKEFTYRSGVIPGRLFYSSLHGSIPDNEMSDIKTVLRDIYRNGSLEGKEFIRVADYTEFQNASPMARQNYAGILKNLNAEFSANPVTTYICGASTWVRAVMRITSSFIKQNFVFTDNVEEAFRQINSGLPAGTNQSAEIFEISSRDISAINSIAGRLLWGGMEGNINDLISDDNPLYDLAHSLAVAANDIAKIMANNREKTHSIKKHEKSLSIARERLQLAMDAGENGFWDWNMDTGEVYLSPRHITMLGYEPGEIEITYRDWVNRIHPEDRERIIPLVRQYAESAQPFSVEFRIKCRDESWKWISTRGKSYRKDERGRPRRVVGVDIDIDEQKRFEELLRRRAEQQAAVAEFGQMVISGISLDSLLEQAADIISRVLKTRFSGVMEYRPGREDFILLHGSGWKEGCVGEATVSANPSTHTGYTLAQVMPVIIEDIEDWQNPETFTLLNDHGVRAGIASCIPGIEKPFGIIGAYHDTRVTFGGDDIYFMEVITNIIAAAIQQEQIVKDLQLAETRFRTVYDSSSDAIMMLDQNGFFDCNRTALSIFGVKNKQEFCSLHPADLSPEKQSNGIDSMTAAGEKIRAAMREGNSSFEWIHRRYDNGKRFPAEVFLTPMELSGRTVLQASVRDITERKLSEKKLRKNEEKFRALFEQSNDAILICDFRGNIIDINKRAEELLEFSREQILSSRIFEFHPESELTRLSKLFEIMLNEGSVRFESEFITGSGEKIYVEISSRVIDREKKTAQGVVRDITERKRVEEELRESRQRLDLSLRGGNLGTWDWHIPSGEVVFNRRWAEMLGYRMEEIKPNLSSWKKLVHPDDLPWVSDILNEHLRGKTDFYQAAFRMKHKSGRWIWIEDKGQVIERDKDGNPLRACGTHLDITQRKQAEEALAESKERYDKLAEQIGTYTWEVNAEGMYTYVSHVVESVLGYKPEDLIGKRHFYDLHSREGLDKFKREAFQIFRRKEKFVKLPNTALTRDGRTIWIETSGIPMLNEQGELIGYRGSDTDITERKRSEIKLQEMNERLKNAIRKANSMAMKARKANTAKSLFLANMSHEIRTPMNGVIGMTRLLLGTDLTDEQLEYAETIQTSGESLLTIINDILDFSKIEAGELSLEYTDFNLERMMEQFAAPLAMKAQEKDLEFICHTIPGTPIHLKGDPGRVRQILTNLAGNAIKFTGEGEVIVTAEAESENVDEARIRFTVLDTGPGIPGEAQEKLFKSFKQLDATTTRNYGGTGLGLAISKQLVEKMGGEIGVNSKPGEGSEFFFVLPFEKLKNRQKDEKTLPNDLRGIRVLLVDDNEISRQIMTDQLAAWGTSADSCGSVNQAIADLREGAENDAPYSAVIIDLPISGMSGGKLVREIRNDAVIPDTVIIFLSTLGEKRKLLNRGIIREENLLYKPLRRCELFDRLTAELNRNSEPESSDISAAVNSESCESEIGAYRILLVEDNLINQKVAIGILNHMDFKTEVAGNGREAIELLEKEEFDLVLMDIQMPEMDGLEATRAIRSPESSVLDHNIPIIAMTAHAMEGDREKCLEAGMNGYTSKPIDPEKLRTEIDRHADRRKSLQS